MQVENVTEFAARYLMEHPDEFPNWRSDARNIMTLFLNRSSTSPKSNGDTYSGAWAYPESSSCCGRSLWYGPMELANVYGQYGVLADSEWAREMARRQIILATYDCHPTGVVEDNIDGGQIVAGNWFKIAHPMALKHVLAAMAWMPDVLGPSRENHIMRSSSVVTNVVYRSGFISYSTADAPANTAVVLRLAFEPTAIKANRTELSQRNALTANGYRIEKLENGDCIVEIRHDGHYYIEVHGDSDPQHVVESRQFEGQWEENPRNKRARMLSGHEGKDTSSAGATMSCTFTGNQVRLLGDFGPDGGTADVYLDGVKQLVPIDCWNPRVRADHVLYYINGLSQAKHTLKVVATGEGNPLSKGTKVSIGRVYASAATGDNGFGEGGGPTGPQRLLFGYAGREDCVDSAGNTWRPATEFVIRSGAGVDSIPASWYTKRTRLCIDGTSDPELYRYGVHGKDFWGNFTVGPGTYHVRLKFAETRRIQRIKPKQRAVTVLINGREVVTNMDIHATAGKPYRAVDLVFNDIEPQNGIICVRFKNDFGGEAIVQAVEIGPGDGGEGATPVSIPEVESKPE